MTKVLLISISLLFALGGCGEKQEKKSSAPGMKCGAGKCGANMFDGNAALVKKKKNIISQMRDNDSRKDCVRKALSTKEMYNCVRDPNGNKLIMKCGTGKCGTDADRAKQTDMKCGAGKCGDNMKTPEPKKEVKKEPAMKCGEGKCGSSM